MKLKNSVLHVFRKYTHFSRFVIVGSFNTFIDFVLYFCFTNLIGLSPVVGSIFSTGIVMIVSFNLNHAFVFRSSKSKRNTTLPFVLTTLFNVWIVQSLVIFVIVHGLEAASVLDSHKWTLNLLAKLGGVCVSFVLNFVMYRYIFHEASGSEPAVL